MIFMIILKFYDHESKCIQALSGRMHSKWRVMKKCVNSKYWNEEFMAIRIFSWRQHTSFSSTSHWSHLRLPLQIGRTHKGNRFFPFLFVCSRWTFINIFFCDSAKYLARRLRRSDKASWLNRKRCNRVMFINGKDGLCFTCSNFCNTSKSASEIFVQSNPTVLIFVPPAIWKDASCGAHFP